MALDPQKVKIAGTNSRMQLRFQFTSRNQRDEFRYVEDGIDAEGHTLVYKMHKYFARRPQNVFRWLLDSYSNEGDVVLDCFCGGGVTLFEGLATGRRVIAVDRNPLATFISDCQTTLVPIKEYSRELGELREEVASVVGPFFKTECRKCGRAVDARWYELAYLVACPKCSLATSLSDSQKVTNGLYRCEQCSSEFAAVDSRRVGDRLLKVVYRCRYCGGQDRADAAAIDERTFARALKELPALLQTKNLWYPTNPIPGKWDRQAEDCLHRKGFYTFADLFTTRHLFANALFLSAVRRRKSSISPALHKLLLFTFSATLRHTNRLSISTEDWMDGRPASWTKHAYWLPNQFVEVNPIEYIEKRGKAIVSGLRFQQRTLTESKRVDTFRELLKGGTHIVWTRSSESLNIPDEAVHLVLTDPPYGSNVQYGELSAFWLAWLQRDLGLSEDFLTLSDEVLVNRKSEQKTYDEYAIGLEKIFKECHRVLKPNGALVFTFNNKDVNAWYSVIRAAVRAGFYLDPKGVVYQEPIENYKNTAHTRFAGTLHGDFVYTFVKTTGSRPQTVPIEQDIPTFVLETAATILAASGRSSTTELYVAIFPKLIPIFINLSDSESGFENLQNVFGVDNIESILQRRFARDPKTGEWYA